MEHRLENHLNLNKEYIRPLLVIGLAILWALTSLFQISKTSIFGNFAGASTTDSGKVSVWGGYGVLNAGPATDALIEDLKTYNLNPEIVGNNTRAFFSVEGKMITLASSNIKVYEYENSDTLISEVEEFKKSAKTPYGAWKKDVHLYNNEKVIVFYLGEVKEIKDALNAIFGNEVVM